MEMFIILAISLVSRHVACEGKITPQVKAFDPCVRINTYSSRKLMEGLTRIKSGVQKCGYTVISRKLVPLGKNTRQLLPLMFRKVCAMLLPIYNYYAKGRPNCLPEELRTNATPVYDMFERFIYVYEVDLSVSKEFCSGKVCTRKDTTMSTLIRWVQCGRHYVRDTLAFACLEGLVFMLESFLKLVVKSGIYRYLEG